MNALNDDLYFAQTETSGNSCHYLVSYTIGSHAAQVLQNGKKYLKGVAQTTSLTFTNHFAAVFIVIGHCYENSVFLGTIRKM